MLKLANINKSYKSDAYKHEALKNVSINFRTNEFVSILGPSGSGKTTLLNIIGGLDKYDSGNLIINNKSTKYFKDKDWDAYRNSCIGFIFQNYNLINHLTVVENVEICMTLSGVNTKEKRKKALEVLEKVGLKKHFYKKPTQLSGGQMQRVAIARALINNPEIILADEPTGALDSNTSIQIMELITEIAKEKLVIMVTHNADLANKYSNRIIELKDGMLISDNNPHKNHNNKSKIKIKKTAMNFCTALKLSFRNIITKKGRTLITSFAASIGIIGIALILSLSNGMNKQINIFEKDTLSNLPIIIEKQTISLELEKLTNIQTNNNLVEYNSEEKIYPRDILNEMNIHENQIDEKYVKHIQNLDKGLYEGITYTRSLKINTIVKNNNDLNLIDINNDFVLLPFEDRKTEYINSFFDILKGKIANEKNELLLIVDSKNRINKELLQKLGFDTNKEITFEDIMEKEIAIATNDSYYEQMGEYFKVNSNLETVYNKSIKAKIVGIIRCKEDKKSLIQDTSGIVYTNKLINYLLENNKNSVIVKFQEQADYDVLTGIAFSKMENTNIPTKINSLTNLGGITTPNAIYIYPKNFNTKTKIINYLDEYNIDKKEEDKIVYVDQAKTMTTISSGLMNAITIILIAFSGISLIVSSIMIGIITYISVLERTKEIGILRALGARKKDIKRVFNAETFIIGLTSGVIGIIIVVILLYPINKILYEITNLKNVAILNPTHATILIMISIILTVIGGNIPANMASRKNPVDALRTE